MRKTVALVALLACLTASAAETLSETFTAGIPDTFTLVDGDGLEPATDMAALGFAPGTPWIAIAEPGNEQNMVAASTSWYRIAGTSDDRMSLPAIEVTSPRAVLQWRARTSDKEYRDGYSVYITTTGSIEGVEPAFTVGRETFAWSAHELSLEAYAGQSVIVVFVNNSRDRMMLMVDDIFVGVPPHFDITTNLADIYNGAGTIPVKVTLEASRGLDVEGVTATYSVGDVTAEQTWNKSIEAGDRYTFTFDIPVTLERLATVPYTITVTSGDAVSTLSGTMMTLPQVIVAEEITGTWCGYCVRGIVAMNQMRRMYPDNFLGVAIHDSSSNPNWPDPMQVGVEEYFSELSSRYGMTGFPNCIVGRNSFYKGDPANIPNYYDDIVREARWTCGLDLTAALSDDKSELTLTADILFGRAVEMADYAVAFLLVEHNVHVGYDEAPMPNGYEQNNSYAGAVYGQMGGFEKLGDVILADDMTYNDVARAIWPSFDGEKGLLAEEISRGDTFSVTRTFAIPDNVRFVDHCEAAVLLIDRNGLIANAAKVSLNPEEAAIDTLEADTAAPRGIYNMQGVRLERADRPGIYIVDGRKQIIH